MKKAICIAMLLLAACSKAKDEPKTTEPDPVPQTNTPEEPLVDRTGIVKKMFEAFNAHNWEAMAKCYTDTAEFLDPSFGKKYVKKTHQQIIKKYSDLQKSAPDIKDEIVEMYTCQDKVVVEFISTGSSGGGTWSLPICTVFTVKDDKIVKDATYYDN